MNDNSHGIVIILQNHHLGVVRPERILGLDPDGADMVGKIGSVEIGVFLPVDDQQWFVLNVQESKSNER